MLGGVEGGAWHFLLNSVSDYCNENDQNMFFF